LCSVQNLCPFGAGDEGGEDYASEVGDACREIGLLVTAEEDVIMLFPALSITSQTAERGLHIFEKSL
jgi:4-aminobutyrate aminotransferase-like enzyme